MRISEGHEMFVEEICLMRKSYNRNFLVKMNQWKVVDGYPILSKGILNFLELMMWDTLRL